MTLSLHIPKTRRVFDITVAHLLAHEGGWSQRYGDQMFMPTVIARALDVPMPVDTKSIIRFALDKESSLYARDRTVIFKPGIQYPRSGD
ncbi:MAG: hypothetical protein MZV63_00340 [Marinilabiliales bacterium]|nr:hypothetical protein [Marinilabiliales bacterium]